MRKTLLFLCFTILIGMSACQEPGQGNQTGNPTPTNTSTPKPTAIPAVWVPQEAPAIRNSISEEEKIARQQAILDGMDRAVPYLQQLEDAGVPVLWRPFHELDGGWFWWSKGGAENFAKLWQLMYSRYTDYWGLDNLIWVFGYSGNGGDMAAWYPGDSYVDLVGADSYTPGANDNLFEECEKLAPAGMPLVFHECGTIPTEKQLKAGDTDWLFFMVWHTDYITKESNNTIASLKDIYNSEYFITLDELPAFH